MHIQLLKVAQRISGMLKTKLLRNDTKIIEIVRITLKNNIKRLMHIEKKNIVNILAISHHYFFKSANIF